MLQLAKKIVTGFYIGVESLIKTISVVTIIGHSHNPVVKQTGKSAQFGRKSCYVFWAGKQYLFRGTY